MSGFKSFAIAGLGNLGRYVAAEFLKAKTAATVDRVVLLTRINSSNPHIEELALKGPEVVAVDYNDKAALVHALTGVDVVISTLNADALSVQVPLAEAARAAGVQVFVPSEFGKATENATEGVYFIAKSNIHATLREIGIAYTLIFTGPFPDFCFIPYFNLDVKSGVVKVGGDGNSPFSLTGRPDVARFLVHIFTQLSPSEVKNKAFRIEGDRKSFNQIFNDYEKRTGRKLTVHYVSVEELEESINRDDHDFCPQFHHHIAIGEAVHELPLDNDKFPGWHPRSAVDYLVD